MGTRSRSNRRSGNGKAIIAIVAVMAAGFICFSSVVTMGMSVGRFFNNKSATSETNVPFWDIDESTLTVAVSPIMEPVLAELVANFNQLKMATGDGQVAAVELVSMTPDAMVSQALRHPSFQAISPDSSLWIDQLEQQWSEQAANGETGEIPIGQLRSSGQTRYAVSPIVLVVWEEVARELGWPEQPVGWQDIQQKATQDATFKWNHAGTNTASGLLATLAEFYAGAGVVRGLTEEQATSQETLDYVEAVESTVRFYGEAEDVIVQRLEDEGRSFLDAFVGQESVVVDWNKRHPENRLIAIYPSEGSLWTDHPLALLELGSHPEDVPVTDNQRETYQLFAEYLRSNEAQMNLLQSGYRPADLSIALDSEGSPFASNDAVDWREPQTTLQMPTPSVVSVVQDAWLYTKRPTNVYLVVDTSGSMEGRKIENTQQALVAFVEQMQGKNDSVGLVDFADTVKGFTPLRELDDSVRSDIVSEIQAMDANGGTALIDAVYAAVVDLRSRGDMDAIKAIVVMTDGLDNESQHSMRELNRLLAGDPSSDIVVFTIAFGDDADSQLLEEMAQSGRGQFRRADETDIKELYRIISTYF